MRVRISAVLLFVSILVLAASCNSSPQAPPTQIPATASASPTTATQTSPSASQAQVTAPRITATSGSVKHFDWPMVRFDQHNTGASIDNTLFDYNFSNPILLRSSVGRVVRGPVAWNGIAIVIVKAKNDPYPVNDFTIDYGGVVTAFDLDSGRESWSIDTGQALISDLIVNQGHVLFLAGKPAPLSYESTFYSVDALTGKTEWKLSINASLIGGLLSGSGFDSGSVYYPVSGPTQNRTSQSQLAIIDTNLKTVRFSDLASGSLDFKPLMDKGTAYGLEADRKPPSVAAWTATTPTGQFLWRVNKIGSPFRYKTLSGGVLLVGEKAEVAAINVNTGNVLWTKTKVGVGILDTSSLLAVAGDRAFVAYDRELSAIDMKDGSNLWSLTTLTTRSRSVSDPIVAGRYVIVLVNSSIVSVVDSATGQVLANYSMKDASGTYFSAVGEIAVADDKLLIPTSEGLLVFKSRAANPIAQAENPFK